MAESRTSWEGLTDEVIQDAVSQYPNEAVLFFKTKSACTEMVAIGCTPDRCKVGDGVGYCAFCGKPGCASVSEVLRCWWAVAESNAEKEVK